MGRNAQKCRVSAVVCKDSDGRCEGSGGGHRVVESYVHDGIILVYYQGFGYVEPLGTVFAGDLGLAIHDLLYGFGVFGNQSPLLGFKVCIPPSFRVFSGHRSSLTLLR